MTDFSPANIAPDTSGEDGVIPETPEDLPEPPAITEQEVGEYREQDRFLPVCTYKPYAENHN